VLFQSFNFEIEDFNKIPNFMEDIECHINAGESFGDFIADHYDIFSNNHDHRGNTCKHDAHGELPFKHQPVENSIQLVYVFFPNDFETNFEESVVTNNNFNYREPSTNLFFDCLFQPPRV